MKNIIVPIDFSDQTDSVLQLASEIGESFGAHVWLLHVAAPEPDYVGYGPGPASVREQVARSLREEHSQVQHLAKPLTKQGLEVTALTIQGPTVQKILAELQNLNADLVIIGSHGHGVIYRTLLGSVSEGVLHGAVCPVLIVPHCRCHPASSAESVQSQGDHSG